MSTSALLKKSDSDFISLKKKLYEFMDFLNQIEKIRRFGFNELPENTLENIDFGFQLSKAISNTFQAGAFKKDEVMQVQKLKLDYNKLLERLCSLQRYVLGEKQKQLDGIQKIYNQKRQESMASSDGNNNSSVQFQFKPNMTNQSEVSKTRSEQSMDGFQIRESGSMLSQNSDQVDPILRQFEEQIKATEEEVSDLTKGLTRVAEMMQEVNQIPVAMKPSKSISNDETFQDTGVIAAEKEKKQFSKLKKVIAGLIVIAILLILVFIIVVVVK